MAANLSLVMDDTDKVRALLRRRASRTGSRCCRRTSTRRTTASSPSTRSRSATAWAASRAPASRRSRRSSRRARRAARSATSSISAGASTSAPSTGARSRRWSAAARSTRSSRAARRCSRRSASRSSAAERAERNGGAGIAVRRGRSEDARSALVATREWTDAERLAAREGRARLLPVRASRITAFAAELSPLVRTPLCGLAAQEGAACWSPASSRRCACRPSRRGKMAFVTLDDGRGVGRDRRLQRDLRRACATCCAKTSWSSPR